MTNIPQKMLLSCMLALCGCSNFWNAAPSPETTQSLSGEPLASDSPKPAAGEDESAPSASVAAKTDGAAASEDEPEPKLPEVPIEGMDKKELFWEGLHANDEGAAKNNVGVMTEGDQKFMDDTNRFISDNYDYWVNKIDSFFVEERTTKIYRGNQLRFRLGTTIDSDGESELITKVRATVRLPRLENKLDIFVETYSPNEQDFDDNVGAEEENNIALGARAYLFNDNIIESNLDTGIRFRPTPDPFVKFRLSKPVDLGDKWIFRPSQIFLYELEDGASMTSRIEFSKRFSKVTAVRSRSEAEWSEELVDEGDNVSWYQSFLYYHTFSRLRGIRLEARVEGVSSPVFINETYRFNARWRQALYSDWLFYEIEPYLRWEREDGWDSEPGITVLLEFNFQHRHINDLSDGRLDGDGEPLAPDAGSHGIFN